MPFRELSDEQYASIENLLPTGGKKGGRWLNHRSMLDGIFWVFYHGARWEDLPPRYGRWRSVYQRFYRWNRTGLFDQILTKLGFAIDWRTKRLQSAPS